jgi:PAS domain S-box-containing protein
VRTLRRYFVTVALALVLLVCAAAGLLAYQIADFGRAQSERQLLETTRALSLVTDGELKRYEAILRSLLTTQTLKAEDWKGFDQQARSLVRGTSAWITVGDRSGRQLVNTRLPPGVTLPRGVPPADMWETLDTGRSRICNLSQGLIQRNILCVDVPVMRDGRAAYHVSVIMRSEHLRSVIEPQRLQKGSFLTILDRRGTVIWRNVGGDKFVGRPGTADVRRALASSSEGVRESQSLEGIPTIVAYSRSAYSGWTFVVGTPRSQLLAGTNKAFATAAAGAFALLLLGALVGLAAARRVSRAIASLSRTTEQIRSGGKAGYEPSGLEEIDVVGTALAEAIEERELSEERLQLAQEIGEIGSWDWDVVRDEGHVSEAYKRMHGLDDCAGPLNLAQVLEAIHPDDLAAFRASLEQARLQSEPVAHEYRVIHPDQSVRWIAGKGRAVRSEDRRFIRAVGIARDITKEREAYIALRQSQERYRRIFEQTSDLIITAGLDQVITDCNPAAAEAVGFTREAAIGQKIADFIRPEDFAQSTQMLRQKVERGGTTQYDVRVRNQAGEWLHWEINSGLTYDAHGTPVGLHVIGRDVTERKRAEERQRLLMNELNHRVKNTLAVVQSITHQTLRGMNVDPAVSATLEARLAALSAAHDVLTRESWTSASMREIIINAVSPFYAGNRLLIDGSADIRLSPQASVSLALAFHELATNASKYGALSNDEGRIRIHWSTAGDRLKLEWVEERGPEVSTPSRRGFGTRMIERSLAGEFGGTTSLTFDKSGLRLTLDAPIPQEIDAAAPP